MSLTAAHVFISPSAKGSFSGPFPPTHLLTLQEGSRPVWILSELPGERGGRVLGNVVPTSPEMILRDGLLFLAAELAGNESVIADLRAWGSLPNGSLTEFDVPEGSYDDVVEVARLLEDFRLGVVVFEGSSLQHCLAPLATYDGDVEIAQSLPR